MNKLSFRARALDANKPFVVYRGDDVPDQLEFGAANRAIAEMPTGMDKEEETVTRCIPLNNELSLRSPCWIAQDYHATNSHKDTENDHKIEYFLFV